MSDASVQLNNVGKMYRHFRSPRYRMLQALGFPVSPANYDEFWAIRDVSLSVARGERLGLVGRNGAGKSTLLKLIAGMIKPSEGNVAVAGHVTALMELGTGFHPDFSGRMNVMSSFAYQGVTGKQARRLLDDVLEFSELDEFIDKPVQTYSAGMYSRLAFAAATAIKPEILIVDEILGAGDAYFAGKSAQRMRALTAEGSTVLFVSHDMSAVQMICDRVVWMERGRVVADGDPIEIGKQYAASIRKQAELRLWAVNLKLRRGHVSELLTDSEADRVFVLRFVTASGDPPLTPLRVSEIALELNGEEIEKVLVGASRDDDSNHRVHLLTASGYMDWSAPASDGAGGFYREFRDAGGQYRHAPASIRVPLGVGPIGEFSVRVTHGGAGEADAILFQAFDGTEYVTLGRIEPGPNTDPRAVSQSFLLAPVGDDASPPSLPSEPPQSEFVYGEGSAYIEAVEFLGRDRKPQLVFAFGEPMRVELYWRARRNFNALAFVICIYGMDGRCVTQVVSPQISATDDHRSGSIEADFSPLMIGKGDYVVSVGIFDGMTEAKPEGDKPLNVLDRQYRIRIVAPPGILMDRGLVVHPVNWSHRRDGV